MNGYTSRYNARYVQENCPPRMECKPEGGKANPAWTDPVLLAVGRQARSARLPLPLPENAGRLYRIEVQAVNRAGEGSLWSEPTFTYPTDEPLTVAGTPIAHIPLRHFQDGGSFTYTVCINTHETPAKQKIAGTGSLTSAKVISEVVDGASSWDAAVKDAKVLSTGYISATPIDNCTTPDEPETENQVVFARDMDIFREWCTIPGFVACWTEIADGDFAEGESADKQSIVFKAYAAKGVPAWHVQSVAGCTFLRAVMAHEVGHAFGLDHPEVGMAPLMFGTVAAHCTPQPYDVAAVMANYQSR